MEPTPQEHTPRGRPPSSSRETLEEAAEQLFLENGYRATSVEQVTQRAGVSRNTYFHYFSAKSDLLFSGLDRAAELIADELAAAPPEAPPLQAVRAAFMHAAESIQARGMPLAVTQWEAMGVSADLRAAGLVRFAGLATCLHRFLASRTSAPADQVRVAAYAITAAGVAAGVEWAATGVLHGSLAAAVSDALNPVMAGFTAAFAASA